MGQNHILVSIIIPCSNAGRLIIEALHSVRNQDCQNWECIVVDDSSTDHTSKLMYDFCENDHRFSYVQNERAKGACGARNTGVDYSKGDYLIFLDADDVLLPNAIEARVAKINKYPENDFLVFSTIVFENEPHDTEILLNVPTTEDLIRRFLNLDVPWLSTGPIWKRESFLKLGLWNEKLLSWQDWELHVRALLEGYTFRFFSIIDNGWRSYQQNATIGKQSLDLAHLSSHLEMLQSFKNKVSADPVYLAGLNQLINWIGVKALEKGNTALAVKSIKLSHHNLHPIKRWINCFGALFFKRYLISIGPLPDFGTMRKIRIVES